MKKIVDLNEYGKKTFIENYELEGLDDELVELAQKLVKCDPQKEAKKKDEYKKLLLAELKARRKSSELSDDELDSAAGGVQFGEERPTFGIMREMLENLERERGKDSF